MGAIYSAVIPNQHVEVDASSSDYTCPKNTVAIRVNDVGSGASAQLVMSGTSVTYDGLVVGDELVGRFSLIDATATTCASLIVLYVV